MHITIASMSQNGIISDEVKRIAAQTSNVVIQTALFDNMLETPYTTLDEIFESAQNFDDLTEKSCDFLMRDNTLFITLGDACQNAIALALVSRTRKSGDTVSVTPHGSTALCMAMQEGIYSNPSGISLYRAPAFERVTNTDNVLVIDEIDTQTAASELKIKLSRYYDDEHTVFLANAKDGTSETLPLYELDSAADYAYYTSVVLPPVPLEKKLRYTFADLVTVMDKLRGKNGCPWDKEQTHDSLKRYLVEESYEVLESIDDNDMNALYDELGDVLLQIVFHAKIAQQHSEFDVSDITSAICNKMITRHTHIFGDAIAHTPHDVIKNWEVIKKEEKNQQSQTDVINGIPKTMPALMRSGKVQHKAAHVGFDFRKVDEAIVKLREEIAEVEADIALGRDMYDECGDLLFSAVNVVRMLKIEPEIALQKATDKFIERFAHVETLAKKQKIDMHNCDIDQLEELWNNAKKMR
ncbi:MAG: nucleoside triphosphate pyrophosphohydrolase [Clostridia bacterium]|mgnify:CR=1 FL=1|jgi:tetrapyrrole methylase family protein / MazG family protein|nr:nucleoside triphosphate pyrophosphohydrolase [Clostridia bacterium]MBT7122966.1 nucleoside triphosphate pyrophosphohydrolase [Clostridia bacterium]